jgi:hypothetical protein
MRLLYAYCQGDLFISRLIGGIYHGSLQESLPVKDFYLLLHMPNLSYINTGTIKMC